MESASKLSSERADKPVQAKKESISLNALWESISKATAFGLPRLTIRRNLRRVTASSSSSIDEEENIDRAKQLDDDGYFERLTRSAQRATKIRLFRRSDSSHISLTTLAACPMIRPVTGDELKRMYLLLLRTIEFWLDVRATALPARKEQSYVYIKEVFNVKEEQHVKWLSWVRSNYKAPQQSVHVAVLEGRNLPSRDVNGLSDPYCVMGVIPLKAGVLEGKRKVKKMKRRRSSGHEEIQEIHPTTSIVRNTVNPKWNEEFTIDIRDAGKDCLQIDIWDYDQDDSFLGAVGEVSKVRGIAGLRSFFGQIGHRMVHAAEDQFMGRVLIPLSTVPDSGFEKWFNVKSRRGREKGGEICLRVQLTTSNSASENSLSDKDFRHHWRIVRQFVRHEVCNSARGGWNGRLHQTALCLLRQHVIQTSVTDLKEAIISWLVVEEFNEKCGVQYGHIFEVLRHIEEQWNARLKLEKNPFDELTQIQVETFFDSLQSYHDWAQNILIKIRNVFPSAKPERSTILVQFLQCLSKSFDVARVRESPRGDFRKFVTSAVSESARFWFHQLGTVLSPATSCELQNILACVEIAFNSVAELFSARDFYDELFLGIDIEYFQITFRIVDIELCSTVRPHIAEVQKQLVSVSSDRGTDECNRMATASYELFLYLRKALELKTYLPASVTDVELFHMHEWFEDLVPHWIELSYREALRRIDTSLKLDCNMVGGDSTKQLCSAPDIIWLISQMIVTWKGINWPDPFVAERFFVFLCERICATVEYFADCMKRRSLWEKKSHFFCMEPFIVKKQLCVLLNDVVYVRNNLLSMPKKLNWDREFASEDSASKSALLELFSATGEDAENSIIAEIAEKMRKDIAHYSEKLVKDLVEVELVDSIKPLMSYLETNLSSLNNWLLDCPFMKILKLTYENCIGTLYHLVKDRYNLDEIAYKRLTKAAETIVAFFVADGDGLDHDSVDTEITKLLFRCVQLRRRSTAILISHYLSKLKSEETKRCHRGYLSVQIGYVETKGIYVKVLHCRNMPSSHRSANPYVTLEPFPASAFASTASCQRTKIQKDTQAPIFDETFHFEMAGNAADKKRCRGAIVFSVLNWSRFCDDSLDGEGIECLSDVPLAASESDVDGLPIRTLSLTLPGEPSGEAFRILRHRRSEEAHRFVEERQRVARLSKKAQT
ncbi:BAI1-associated protein 3-like isoform X2 [Oscarella lobularis]|uniref:BAI1-associated protein 3-like isoform X2 n=1 Tax=Oscarella lobularis TaxID=121494 RepID=UPI0033134A1A